MHRKGLALAFSIFLAAILLFVLFQNGTPAVLDGAGPVAEEEALLLIHASLLMLVVVLPVLGLLFFFAWRYRASNKKAAYAPNWEHGKMDELVWWVIPLEMVLVLGALTYSSTYALDPRKPLISPQEPMTIQVVALPWKWLFIYPELGIASLNFVQLPVDVPITFKVTADAPMNSFWIPRLGGQVYAMTGMETTLRLMAKETGDFPGSSANYSGEGFAGMQFTARAGTEEEFYAWVASVRDSNARLDADTYKELLIPVSETDVRLYSSADPAFFHAILKKFNY